MNELYFDSINFSYKNHKILSGVYSCVKTGEIFGIFGRNGCGKTTLFKWIYGLLPDDKGIVKVNNMPIKKQDRWKHISYLPQHSFLPDEITVKQAIHLFYNRKQACLFYEDERISEIAKSRIRTLSGGEKRYLEFRIIYDLGRPFILFDELFSKIEPRYIQLIYDKMKQKLNKTGIIITGHNHREIRKVCTRISVMNGGTIKEIENTDEELIKYRYLPEK